MAKSSATSYGECTAGSIAAALRGGSHLVEGAPFGRYRLVELLGRGGMGEVWRAYDTAIDRVVALKMLLGHFAADTTFEQRFRREARAAARLEDPHVVPIYDVGEIGGRLYVTMRLIKGRDLQTLLNSGPLEPARAVAIVDQVAGALHAAHQAGLVHRDVKPSNILLTDDDFAYLIDFGIARAAGESGLTSASGPVGTWLYMAPERFRAGNIGPSCDVYALACVLYQCLTGKLPFPGSTLEQIAMAHMSALPTRPTQVRYGIPPALDEVIATGLAKDPTRRYRTAKDLGAAARSAISPVEGGRLVRGPASAHSAGSWVAGDSGGSADRMPSSMAIRDVKAASAPLSSSPSRTPSGPLPAASTPRFESSPAHTDQQRALWAGSISGPLPVLPSPPRRARINRRAIITVAVATAVVLAAVVALTIQMTRPAAHPAQTALPFPGLDVPWGVAVDAAHTLYVSDSKNNRVLKLASGTATPTPLPFTGLSNPFGATVDNNGNVYVTDKGNNRVLKLAAGSSVPTELPFSGLNLPVGVAVDSDGNLYVTDYFNNRVMKLAAGAPAATALPFSGLSLPHGVAVDGTGDIYVSDTGNNRVVKLAAGSSTQTELPFTGVNGPWGATVDPAGNVYITDYFNNRVLKLATGSSSQTELPFTGLNHPAGVAVDNAGTLYVVDGGNNDGRVLKLPAS